ncbi:unnamed protein product [Caenorhabditis angaria]|uniref:Uncharacterized protein n=1 Tax=Caenorhabditis angaria TaxID=860376 RepID=A0A9P1MWU3_9PELO|nr:unnamed protein product [Caenorhabditis angaria]
MPPQHAYNPMGFQSHHPADNAVISSAPQINRSSVPGSHNKPVQAVMSAAPELRNLRKETVKLVPAQLMRKTEKAPNRPIAQTKRRPEAQQAKSTDEAYNDFMKELDGLI